MALVQPVPRVIDAVQMLDQQIAAVRPSADKLLHLGQRLRLGLAPLELAPTPARPRISSAEAKTTAEESED
jgi:hypothetical protein